MPLRIRIGRAIARMLGVQPHHLGHDERLAVMNSWLYAAAMEIKELQTEVALYRADIATGIENKHSLH